MLIYDYERTLSQDQLAFFETFQNQGEEVEKVFRDDANDGGASSNSKALADRVKDLQRSMMVSRRTKPQKVSNEPHDYSDAFNNDQDGDFQKA